MKQIAFISILISLGVHSQEVRIERLNASIDSGLVFLERTQYTQTDTGHRYAGEWPCGMGLRKRFTYIGTPGYYEDANCFSVGTVHNALAEIYLQCPEYTSIPDMLSPAFRRVMSYRNGERFNFWNLLPPRIRITKDYAFDEQPLVRRPTDYPLKGKFINRAANVVEDADDTSIGYLAIALRKKVLQQSAQVDTLVPDVDSIGHLFSSYRDADRSNMHWYNYINGMDRNTGAFLTWHGAEYEFRHWDIFRDIAQNLVFFMPGTECYPAPYTPYMPYGSNDVDAVVNANVLTVLSEYGEMNSRGVDSCLTYLAEKCSKRRYDAVATYYPNRFQFPYAVARAYASGVEELAPSLGRIKRFLLKKQKKDGGWSARWELDGHDRLQSTIYAVNALLNMDCMGEKKVRSAVDRGIDFILEHTTTDSQGEYWMGGVFFSGGTLVRKRLFWKSDAVTTALALQAIVKYREYLKVIDDQMAEIGSAERQ